MGKEYEEKRKRDNGTRGMKKRKAETRDEDKKEIIPR
jgi:hypothetical protein